MEDAGNVIFPLLVIHHSHSVAKWGSGDLEGDVFTVQALGCLAPLSS